MYIIRNEHLEKLKKALEKSNEVLAALSGNSEEEDAIAKAITQNKKAISLINDEYLDIKPHYEIKD